MNSPRNYAFYEPFYPLNFNGSSFDMVSYNTHNIISSAPLSNYYNNYENMRNAFLSCIDQSGFDGVLTTDDNYNGLLSCFLQFMPAIWLKTERSFYAEYLFGLLSYSLGFSSDFSDLSFPDFVSKYGVSDYAYSGSEKIALSVVYEVLYRLDASIISEIGSYSPFRYYSSIGFPISSVESSIDFMHRILNFLGVPHNA